jgi:acetyl esterase/lipase
MKTAILRFILALLIVLSAMAPSAVAAEVDIIQDVVYGHKDGMALTFDVIKPKTNANGAAVIYMVSGGWVSGFTPPQQAATRFAYLLDKGFTVIPVRHGSSPKYLIPEIVGDVRRAIRYIRHHAKSWGVDPDRMGVTGGSAGGHLSLMLATASDSGDPNATEAFLKESNRVTSVVALYPPVDLRQWARGVATGPRPANERFPALNFEREKAPDYSPIVHVTRDDPPTLLIHGDKDELVPISHSQNLYKALQETGIKSEFVTIPGAGHGFRGADAERSNALLLAWFEQTLLARPAQTSR